MKEKKLYRSRKDRVFFGVCGGLADYFDLDPALVRLIVVVIAIWGGVGIVAYILGAIIFPEEPAGKQGTNKEDKSDFSEKVESAAQQIKDSVASKSQDDKRWIGGVVLITLGLLFLAQQFVPILDFGKTWPLFLIVLGIIVIFAGRKE